MELLISIQIGGNGAVLLSVPEIEVQKWLRQNVGDAFFFIKKISSFISKYYGFFHTEICTLMLAPIEGFGKWDGKNCFGTLPLQSDYQGQVCVLTRATIRITKLKSFWKNVPAVAAHIHTAKGLEATIGIGEAPFIKQATFSIWQNKDSMKAFTYNMKNHADVIKKTRSENWYKEEMFVRFRLIKSYGSLNGKKYF